VVESSGASLVDASRCPLAASTNVVVLADTAAGVGHYSAQWEQQFWSWWQTEDGSVVPQFVSKDELLSCSARELLAAGTYVQPGGNAYEYSNSLGQPGQALLRAFVAGGGLYVGTCAGWYYASPGYYWEMDTTYSDRGFWQYPTLLGVFGSVVEGSIAEIVDMEGPEGVFEGETETSVSVVGGATHTAAYFGGPTLGLHQTAYPPELPRGTTVHASFAALPRKNPAIVTVQTPGRRLALFSVHLEAWEGLGNNVTTPQRKENYELRRDVISGMMAESRPSRPDF